MMNEEPTDRLTARDDPQRADAARVAPTQRARVISGRFVPAPPGPPSSDEPETTDSEACRTCCGAGPYLLALAAQSVVLLQFNVHPSVGGPSGALSSALQTAPSQVWLAAHIALAALGVALYALRASRRMLIAWCVVIAIVALGASMGQVDLYPLIRTTPELDPPELDLLDLRIFAFFIAPATGVMLFNRIRGRARTLVGIAVGVAAAFIVIGWGAGRVIGGSFTEEERPYVERIESAQYPCYHGFIPWVPSLKAYPSYENFAARVTDLRVTNLELLGGGAHRARIRVHNTWGIPAYSVSLHFSQETIMAVRPDHLVVCLTDGPEQRAEEVGDDGLPYPAPWRWQRSADGGASWADVPHSPHRESDKTARYTFRYVPTLADLADERVRLRACVNVRGGGEVCTAGASPRP